MSALWPAPLAAAVIGVESLEASVAFYRDVVGLEPLPVCELGGDGFCDHWGLPRQSRARAVVLEMRGVGVGRVVLIEFAAARRLRVRRPGEYTIRGLWNLNFYVGDIRTTCAELAARAFALWSDPVEYQVSERGGSPVEALFDGPDGVAINLVEPRGEADTIIGRVRIESERYGRTRTGWTAIATTSHSVHSPQPALAFYREVLGQRVLMDEVLDKPQTNHFLRRPRDARTRAIFLAGDHFFGKIALSHNLNYAVADHVEDARAPNIGYLAQSFIAPDVEAAFARSLAVGAVPFSAPLEVDAWGGGRRSLAAMVRNPGSGALMQLVGPEGGLAGGEPEATGAAGVARD
jgi:catechol 2,3-dioxygenase-like lactoylglutathione lyase family enzyme